MKKVLLIISIFILCLTAVRIAVNGNSKDGIEPISLPKILAYVEKNTASVDDFKEAFTVLEDVKLKYDEIRQTNDSEGIFDDILDGLLYIAQGFEYIVAIVRTLPAVISLILKDCIYLIKLVGYLLFGQPLIA